MRLRRLLAAVPLAVLVAVLAHVAGFGGQHAPGGDHAAGLLRLLGAALALLGFGAFFGVVFSRDRVDPKLALGLVNVLLVAGLAAVAFAAIEYGEGHLAFSGALRAWLALLPLTGLVALLARHVGRAVARAGNRFAAYGRSRVAALATAFHLAIACRPAAYVLASRGVHRGRAPPLLT